MWPVQLVSKMHKCKYWMAETKLVSSGKANGSDQFYKKIFSVHFPSFAHFNKVINWLCLANIFKIFLDSFLSKWLFWGSTFGHLFSSMDILILNGACFGFCLWWLCPSRPFLPVSHGHVHSWAGHPHFG